jgi:hypothetical protein
VTKSVHSYEVWGFHGSEGSYHGLLGYDTTWSLIHAASIIRIEVRQYVPLKGWYSSSRLCDVITHKDTIYK